jgi:6-phosphogluconate dehydrogenase
MKGLRAEIGVIGLGVMGKNLALNIMDKGFSVAGYDVDQTKAELLAKESPHLFYRARSFKDITEVLRLPRAMILLVPAGIMVDNAVKALVPHLSKGDVVLDCGNSYFRDTEARGEALRKEGIHFMGVGVSGGEKGARFGPSIMAGGPIEGYERIEEILEAIAARADGKPCVSHLGPRSAGDYVKMVHNGIEYGLIEVLAEAYHLLKVGMRFSNNDIQQVFNGWNSSDLKGYLVEITTQILGKKDAQRREYLVDLILDEAKEKGTGKWTVQDAAELNVPVPTIAMSVAMRDMSRLKIERVEAAQHVVGPNVIFSSEVEGFVTCLHKAVTFAMLATYAQGMALLHVASKAYGYDLDLKEVARIWSAGSIIRSDLLGPVQEALRDGPGTVNLFQDPTFVQFAASNQADLRHVVATACAHGIPTPALGASLAYFDAYRSSWLPANLIQAQRDFFGSHGYRMIDREGMFHTEWEE